MMYMPHDVMGRPPAGQWLQYVNRDQLDCRKANLRFRERYKNVWGEVNLWRKYGIDERSYQEMLAAQDGKCAICGMTPEERNGEFFDAGKVPAAKRRLHVDHSHVTDQVRGLLCWACNIGLGKFRDDPQRLRAAADYLDARNPFGIGWSA